MTRTSSGELQAASLGYGKDILRMNANVLCLMNLADVDTLMTVQTLRGCFKFDRLCYILSMFSLRE